MVPRLFVGGDYGSNSLVDDVELVDVDDHQGEDQIQAV
jgi:hypothetical protein